MRYVISDIHGEYDLFRLLLESIKFSEKDTLYICGDILDKGTQPVRLAKAVSMIKNAKCILGNHEYEFLKYYHSLLQSSPKNFDEVLRALQAYFPDDGCLLDWETVDWIEDLPAYIEEDEFICVHAGIPTGTSHRPLSLEEIPVEQLIYDRRFKDPDCLPDTPKCVFFGHTQTDCICGEHKILGYRRDVSVPAKTVGDFVKIHLDTGAWASGVLGCFCIDTLKAIYVKK